MRSPREFLCWLLGHSWWEEKEPYSAEGWCCWHCPAWERDKPTSRWTWRMDENR